MSGDTERLVRDFCTWWEARGHDATAAEGERIARELLGAAGPSLGQSDVDAYCAKLKRGFAGGRTILAANEVGEALVEWLGSTGGASAGEAFDDFGPEVDFGQPGPGADFGGELDLPNAGGGANLGADLALPSVDGPIPDDGLPHDGLPHDGLPHDGLPSAALADGGSLDELSWGDASDDDLLAGITDADLPPIPDGELPPLPSAGDGPPLAAPDMSFEEPELSLDERVDAIGGRDVFAASDAPSMGLDLDLDLDADMIGKGDKAHYVREEEMELGGGAGLDVDVDPNAPNAQTDDVLDLGAVDAGFDGDVDVPDELAADLPRSRASAAPVGHGSSSRPPPPSPLADEDTREDLPALTTPPPPAPSSRQPIMIGVVLVLLIAVAAAATFIL